MMPNLFCFVVDGVALPPAPLPEVATAHDGRLFSSLADQLANGRLAVADIAELFDLWPATLDEASFDPASEAPTDLVMTIDPIDAVVVCFRGKRPLTADELAARRASAVAARVEAVNAQRDQHLTGGFTYDFGGDIGPKTLQTRDAEDKVNWLISRGAYRDAVAAGHGSVPGATFRSADNTTFTVTIAAGLAALVAMETWGAGVMARSWALKDTLAAGTDPAGLDITQGWPG